VVIAIHTKIRGRTRFHIQNLYRSPELKALLESRLVQRPDVFDVRCNVVSGNLLIFYSSNYTHQKIASVIEHILQEAVHLSSSPKTARSRKRKKVFFTRKAASDSRKLPLVSPSVDEQPTAPWHIMNETDIFERLTSLRKGLP
jgi:Ca2+-transporting ATPase